MQQAAGSTQLQQLLPALCPTHCCLQQLQQLPSHLPQGTHALLVHQQQQLQQQAQALPLIESQSPSQDILLGRVLPGSLPRVELLDLGLSCLPV